ncbi:hypothetical protein GTP81_30565 [Rugamonas sp. FT107W]|uniref:Lipoprotein n=1 Tax=Duganella vulcania TaxID=2692166 RepID=A0A845HQW9_9BURK|nr:hypothetical protein [Duganella vulcania]MYN21087.1 hypothetical protein [Duganella vulcania]
MKSVYLRSGLALACAALLNACGGGNGNLALSGTISGLTKPDLVLINKKTGERLAIPANTSSFVFTRLAAVDEEFDIEIDTPPTGAKCTPVGTSNVGKANAYTSYQIGFTCVTNPWTLGGNVSGLRYPGLVLANGADLVSVLPAATADAKVGFTFPSKVGDGSPYGVTVLSQPADPATKQTQVCSVANPTGNMPAKDYGDLVVTCN